MAFDVLHMNAVLADAISATTVGDALEVSDFRSGSVQVTGTFVASLQLQVSNDGTTWVSLGGAIAAAGLTTLAIVTRYIRANTTWTSGTSITITMHLKR